MIDDTMKARLRVAPDGASPRDYRCETCGELNDGLGGWRMAGGEWEHRCAMHDAIPQAGHLGGCKYLAPESAFEGPR